MRSVDERFDADGALVGRRLFVSGAEVTQAEFDVCELPPTLSELAAEVRGIRDRARAVEPVDEDARAVRDAVAGPRVQ